LGISKWQRENFRCFKKTIYQLKKRLDAVQGREDEQVGEEALQLKKEINSFLDQDDMKWEQRTKADWLKLGDPNTKFFHACANQRRKSN
jgi:hypothetical protein